MVEYVAGRVDITPERNLPLAGYGARHGDADGVESRLEANVVLIRNEAAGAFIALVQLDTLFSSAALEERILEAMPVALRGACTLVCMASHTHFAPSLDPEKPALGRVDPDYMAMVAQRVGGAIAAAHERGAWREGSWQAGRAPSGSLAVSRRSWRMMIEKKPPFVRFGIAKQPNLKARVDTDIRVVTLMGRDGAEIAMLWHFACHPVASPHGRRVSADFVGTVRAYVRGGEGRAELPVLFVPGFMGDIRPYLAGQRVTLKQRIMTPFGKLFGTFNEADYKAWTGELIACVERAAAAGRPLVAAHDDVAHDEAGVEERGLDLSRVIDGLPRAARMGVWNVAMGGGLRIVCCGAEMVNGYAAAAGQDVAAEVGAAQDGGGTGLCLAAGYTGPVFGYLPTDLQIREGGYESEEFFTPFNLAGARFKARIAHEVVAVLGGA